MLSPYTTVDNNNLRILWFPIIKIYIYISKGLQHHIGMYYKDGIEQLYECVIFFFFFKLFLSIYSPCTLKFPSKVDPKNLGDLKKKELHPIYSSNPKETKGYVKNNFYFFYYNNIIMQNIDRVNPMDHEELYGSWRTFRTFHNFFWRKI